MQEVQKRQCSRRPYQRQLAPAREHQTPQGCLMLGAHGLYQEGIGGAGSHARGSEVQAASGVEQRIDLAEVEEAVQGQGAVAGGPQPLQLGLIKDEELSGGVLVTLDDGGGIELAVVWTALVVANALATAGMEQMGGQFRCGDESGIGLDAGQSHQNSELASSGLTVSGT